MERSLRPESSNIERREGRMMLVALKKGAGDGLEVQPRWPAKRVLIDALALEKLRAVQSKLPAGLGLILTRGYEAKSSNLGLARRQLRAAGIMLFKLFYPQRRNELLEIFGSNGHDVDGNHVDVSISLNGRRVELLPLSVFTPEAWQQRRVRKSAGAVELVQAALKDAGFRIHRNPTESLQIHCDLIPSETK